LGGCGANATLKQPWPKQQAIDFVDKSTTPLNTATTLRSSRECSREARSKVFNTDSNRLRTLDSRCNAIVVRRILLRQLLAGLLPQLENALRVHHAAHVIALPCSHHTNTATQVALEVVN
jgi:hypothetical protein